MSDTPRCDALAREHQRIMAGLGNAGVTQDWIALAQKLERELSKRGWKLVPMEPTEEMKVAGNDTGEFEWDYPRDSRRAAANVYRTMLAAAPELPK